MAAMLGADIEALRGYGEVVPGVDFPISFYGRFDAGALRRVLIDSMYDTTAADEPGWVVPRASDSGPPADTIRTEPFRRHDEP